MERLLSHIAWLCVKHLHRLSSLQPTSKCFVGFLLCWRDAAIFRIVALTHPGMTTGATVTVDLARANQEQCSKTMAVVACLFFRALTLVCSRTRVQVSAAFEKVSFDLQCVYSHLCDVLAFVELQCSSRMSTSSAEESRELVWVSCLSVDVRWRLW